MYYSDFKGEKISLLGMGCMRFPSGPKGGVDEEEGVRIIRQSIDRGVTYMDTAYMYHSGLSEKILGKALKDGYRDKVLVADKMPPWYINKQKDLDEIFEEQLRRLDLDCIDIYLIHDIHDTTWETTKKYDILGFMEKKRAEGKIRYIGFSYHGDADLFEEVIDAYPWDLCQIQYNYLDEDFQAGRRGLEYARSKGVPVVIMEPLKGGKLATGLPRETDALFEKMSQSRPPVEWAFSWLADQPGILTILSGMSSMEQLEHNLKLFDELHPGCMSEEDMLIMSGVRKILQGLTVYDCTKCQYCMPCPVGLNIPKLIDFYNQYRIFGDSPAMRESYEWIKPDIPSNCVTCKKCEKLCPQHLHISEAMAKAAEAFQEW